MSHNVELEKWIAEEKRKNVQVKKLEYLTHTSTPYLNSLYVLIGKHEIAEAMRRGEIINISEIRNEFYRFVKSAKVDMIDLYEVLIPVYERYRDYTGSKDYIDMLLNRYIEHSTEKNIKN